MCLLCRYKHHAPAQCFTLANWPTTFSTLQYAPLTSQPLTHRPNGGRRRSREGSWDATGAATLSELPHAAQVWEQRAEAVATVMAALSGTVPKAGNCKGVHCCAIHPTAHLPV